MKLINKKLIALILLIVGIAFLIKEKPKEVILDKVNLTSNKDSNMFAIMLEQEDGTYLESDEHTWPTDGERLFDEEKSGCIDNMGNALIDILAYDDINNMVKVRTTKAVYCYIYFSYPIPDIKIDVSTDGVAGSLPTTGGYKNTLSCNDSTYSWNGKYQRIEFSSVSTDEVKCNLDYIKDTETHTSLISEVQSKATTNANGYRYSGKTPNNWIWFNNELWRIIGSIPTCTSSGCETQENLVKIIRADAIGRLPYNDYTGSGGTTALNESYWGNNSLYYILNNYYYSNDINTMDATNTNYCVTQASTNTTNLKSLCDYRYSGILSTSYYGKMVKNVYWNTGKYLGMVGSGASQRYTLPSDAYANEIATQTVSGYVGIMSPSDYGYAASSSYYNSTALKNYNTAVSTNWLFSGVSEWIIAPYGSNSGSVQRIQPTGSMWSDAKSNTNGFLVRPVVYLDSSVYLVSGSGTFSDPYIVGI